MILVFVVYFIEESLFPNPLVCLLFIRRLTIMCPVSKFKEGTIFIVTFPQQVGVTVWNQFGYYQMPINNHFWLLLTRSIFIFLIDIHCSDKYLDDEWRSEKWWFVISTSNYLLIYEIGETIIIFRNIKLLLPIEGETFDHNFFYENLANWVNRL